MKKINKSTETLRNMLTTLVLLKGKRIKVRKSSCSAQHSSKKTSVVSNDIKTIPQRRCSGVGEGQLSETVAACGIRVVSERASPDSMI